MFGGEVALHIVLKHHGNGDVSRSFCWVIFEHKEHDWRKQKKEEFYQNIHNETLKMKLAWICPARQ